MKDFIKKKKILILSILLSILLMISITYAYFSAKITNDESGTTITLDSGDLSIVFDGGANISVSSIYPQENAIATKTFTVTGTNSTELTMPYSLSLVIDTNEFTQPGLKFELSGENVSHNGTSASNISLTDIINTTSNYSLGSGFFLSGNNSVHSYTLKIYYVDTDQDQSADKGARFAAHVAISANSTQDNTLRGKILGNNNANVSSPLSTPGMQNGYTLDEISGSMTIGVSSTYAAYYWTYGTGYELQNDFFNLTGVSTLLYSTDYSNLVGKYLAYDFAEDASLPSNKLSEYKKLYGIYYVTAATSTEITVKSYKSPINQKEAVLASTKDDYGTSYYYRGSVENNYLIFAKMCWRIVRITGNGAVKLVLYNSNNSIENPCDSSNPRNEISPFINKLSFNTNNGDNGFIGYMYGNNFGTYGTETHKKTNELLDIYFNSSSIYYFGSSYTYDSVGKTYKISGTIISGKWSDIHDNVLTNAKYSCLLTTSDGSCNNVYELTQYNNNYLGYGYALTNYINSTSYSQAHANINKSNVLNSLEDWYVSNLADYSENISDVIWCNDKSYNSSDEGYGANNTSYSSSLRFKVSHLRDNTPGLKLSPSLICPKDNAGGKLSKFTVHDTVNGNGNLTYSIGLLTADEVAFAGMSPTFYLNSYASVGWFTLSPSEFYYGVSIIAWEPFSNEFVSTTGSNEVRPSIAINGSINIFNGTGTSQDPYIVN